MEAKTWQDTVIHYGKVMIPSQEERESKQAEISFKAGEQEGYETGFNDGQNYSFIANQTVQSIKDKSEQAGRQEGYIEGAEAVAKTHRIA